MSENELPQSEKIVTKEELRAQAKQEKLKKEKKQHKERKPGLFKKLREAWGELKKTTWPTFKTVVKKTGIVLGVVVIFTVVLFAIDLGLGALYRLLLG